MRLTWRCDTFLWVVPWPWKVWGLGLWGSLYIIFLWVWTLSGWPSWLSRPSLCWGGVGGGGWYREREAAAPFFHLLCFLVKKNLKLYVWNNQFQKRHPTNAIKTKHFWDSLLFVSIAWGVQVRFGKVAGGFSPWVIVCLYFCFFYFLTTQREQLIYILVGRFEGCLPSKMLQ